MARFTVGPWNVHEGADSFGPEVRKSIPMEEKFAKFKSIGLSGVQFHDDDAVPNMNNMSEQEIIKEAVALKATLDKHQLAAEFVAPRLWMDSHTTDGGFTSNSDEDREFALWRAKRSVDIARALGSDKIVLWLAREGTLCAESKDPVLGVKRLTQAIDTILNYDSSIKVLVEPKPNEPIDRSFCPTIGHVAGLAASTVDPSRVGVVMESAHAVLAGLDPAIELAYALALGKLWSVHLNDQNSIRYDQDKSFGAENLRSAFNQVKVLIDNDYGKNGEYVGLDVKVMRTQKDEDCYRHIENSLKVYHMLEEKVKRFDKGYQAKCIRERNYEKLEMYVLELLMS